MRRLCRCEAGISMVEVVVGLAVVCVLAAMILAWLMTRPARSSQLSDFRQLQLAAQTMALDGTMTGDTNLAWPGDLEGRFSTWAKHLVPDYLSTNDFCKLVSGPGVTVRSGRIPLMKDTAVRVYGVSSNSTGEAVFLTSANFTNTPTGGLPLDPKAKPYGDKGFVVFRLGGDGAILLKSQATNTNLIGTYAPMLRE